MAKTQIAIRIDPELLERIDALAGLTGLTRTEIAERAMASGLKQGEQAAVSLGNPIIRRVVEAVMTLDPSTSAEDKATLARVARSVGESRKRTGRKPSTGGA